MVSNTDFLFTQVVPGLSVGYAVRVAEVGVRRALILGARVVIGIGRGSSPFVITLVLSPDISVGDIVKATGGKVMMTPSLSIGVG